MLALLISQAGGTVARAQTALAVETAPIHWAFAPYFGTGSYRAAGAEKILALSFGVGKKLRDASLSEAGERQTGFRFRMPIALSVHNFDSEDILGSIDFDNLSTLSAVPGLEIDIPRSERWSLKPIVHLGWGSRIDGSNSSWIYWAGVRSALAFERGKLRFELVNGLTGVGYTPHDGPSERLYPLLNGLDFTLPLANSRLGGDPVFLHWQVAHTHYLDDNDFGVPDADGERLEIAREWGLGVAFSKGEKKLRLWRLAFDRVGLTYRFDGSGDFNGVGLVVSSLFDR